jgi:hypothetical protein
MGSILIVLMLLAVVGTLVGTACGLILGALFAEDILEFLYSWA